MPRNPRIALEPEALRALRLWAALEDKEPSTLVSQLIMDYLPSEVKGLIRTQAPEAQEVRRAKEPLLSNECGAIIATVSKQDKPKPVTSNTSKAGRKLLPRLAKNADALEIIKRMWASGERRHAEIAAAIGYPRSTVGVAIERMKEAGELQESPSEAQTD